MITMTSTLLEQLNWRYPTKKMDPSKKVPQDKVDTIVEAIRMTPTSSGTQPFELLVVTNPDKLAQIQKAASDQTQITEGSHLLVFAAWDNYTKDRIDAVTDLNVEARGDLPLLSAYYENLKNNYLPRDAEVTTPMPRVRRISRLGWHWLPPLNKRSTAPRWRVSTQRR
jgi:nitroreductase/dihydropteridine reductase